MSAYLRKYATGTGADVRIQLVSPTTGRFIDDGDWTPAAGDIKVSIDGGSAADLDSEPTYSNGWWIFVFTNGELTGKRVTVKIVDADGPAVLDDSFEIETFGHASACYPPDYSTGVVPDGAITEAAFDADTAKYQAKVVLVDDDSGGVDLYLVTFFKNGQPYTGTVTSPTIQVVKAADGTDLIASTALTQIGSTKFYKKSSSTRTTAGSGYIAVVGATLDGIAMTWSQPVGRDSTA